ncbi:MAG: serine/threonine-protein phosphatase, partial [Pseudonocardiales bacterium]|nr:serine/threonine-protein phosphatase [Pseudonocardiales bacterium]
VTAPTLLDTLSDGTPHSCADRLIELALRGGGPDNVTCIVADVVDQADGDDRPVVAGAFIEAGAAVEDGADSPASRAAKISRDDPQLPVLVATGRSRRRLAFGALFAVLLVAAAIGGWAWTQSQYFVGKDGHQVAAFKGVNAHFGPITLYSVIENSDLKIDDLNSAARSQVLSGIIANDRADADQILKRLEGELLPLCTVTSGLPNPTATPTPSAVTTPASTTRAATGSTKAGSTKAGSTTTTPPPPGPARTSTANPPVTPPAPTTALALPASTPEVAQQTDAAASPTGSGRSCR